MRMWSGFWALGMAQLALTLQVPLCLVCTGVHGCIKPRCQLQVVFVKYHPLAFETVSPSGQKLAWSAGLSGQQAPRLLAQLQCPAFLTQIRGSSLGLCACQARVRFAELHAQPPTLFVCLLA